MSIQSKKNQHFAHKSNVDTLVFTLIPEKKIKGGEAEHKYSEAFSWRGLDKGKCNHILLLAIIFSPNMTHKVLKK